jgi:hypothetical protein
MGYDDPIREGGPIARRDLLDAAVVLGAHLDAPEGVVDDEMLVRALGAFMEARASYVAWLGARYGIAPGSGPPSTHAGHGRARAGAPLRPDGLTPGP